MIEYLLSTTSEEMEYETVRCRPLITEDFFTFLGQQIGMLWHHKISNLLCSRCTARFEAGLLSLPQPSHCTAIVQDKSASQKFQTKTG